MTPSELVGKGQTPTTTSNNGETKARRYFYKKFHTTEHTGYSGRDDN